MIVCSCNAVSGVDIERALVEILDQPDAPLPTPGVVFRHMQNKMNCCGCAPLVVEVIYATMTELVRLGRVCPYKGEQVCGKLLRLVPRNRSIRPCSNGAIEPMRLVG